MELYLTITTSGQLKSIVLGNINYITKSYRALKHGMYNADALRNELLDILNLSDIEVKSSNSGKTQRRNVDSTPFVRQVW